VSCPADEVGNEPITGGSLMKGESSSRKVTLGVDTHLDVHVGAAIDQAGRLLGTKSVSANSIGYQDLFTWASSFGIVNKAGIEGTGTYGAGLYKSQKDRGVCVIEVNRPDRASRRLQGKSDTTDAVCAAKSVLSGKSTAIPKQQSGACEALRITSVARRSAIKAKTQAINQIRSLLVSSPQDIREKLWCTKAKGCVDACLKVKSLGDTTLLQAMTVTLKLLATRWLMLSEELNQLDRQLDNLTQKHASQLRHRFGVGPQTAAILLSVAGDNPERLKNESALASMCGVNPLPASSGKITRHRLNRGGSRIANNALWTIVMVRMRSDPRTQSYVDRRTAEGLTNKEIQRCLKRYIVRELFPVIMSDLANI
jgi:transposase